MVRMRFAPLPVLIALSMLVAAPGPRAAVAPAADPPAVPPDAVA